MKPGDSEVSLERDLAQDGGSLEISENSKELKGNRDSVGQRESVKTTLSQKLNPSLRISFNGSQESSLVDLRLSSVTTRLSQDDRPKTIQGFSNQLSPRYMSNGTPDLSKLDQMIRSNAKKQSMKSQQKLVNNELNKSPGVQVAKVTLKTSLKSIASLCDQTPDVIVISEKLTKNFSVTSIEEKNSTKQSSKAKASKTSKSKVQSQDQADSKCAKKSEAVEDKEVTAENVKSPAPKKSKTKVKEGSTANNKGALDSKTAKTSFADSNSTRLSSEQEDGFLKDPYSLEKIVIAEPGKKAANSKNLSKKLPSSPSPKISFSKGSEDYDISQIKAVNSNDSTSTNESKAPKPIEKVLRSGSSYSFSSQEELTNVVLPVSQEKKAKALETIETQETQPNNEEESTMKDELVFTPNEKINSQPKPVKPSLHAKISGEKKFKKDSAKPLSKKNEIVSQAIKDPCVVNLVKSPSKSKSGLNNELATKAPWKNY